MTPTRGAGGFTQLTACTSSSLVGPSPRVVDDLFPAALRRLTYHPRASHASTESEVHVLLAHGSSVQSYGVVDPVRTTPRLLSHVDHCFFSLMFQQAPLRLTGMYLMIDPFFDSSLLSSFRSN